MTQRVRLFVSSPGDTRFERMRIDRVVERLNGEFAGIARLETIRWELEFYKAHATFQQQIPEAADCDVVIAILRHRLGTPLPDDFAHMSTGEPYPSGTAYEILTAIDSGRARGLPDVYVFRNPESPTVRLDDAQTSALVTEQWERLKSFFSTWFQTPDGHFTAAFQEFRTTDEFEVQVEALLRKWLADRILKGRPVVWPIATKGSPFRGLAAFGSRHAPVFFGRSRDIPRAIDALKDASGRGAKFILVVGPSGAGKSSLAHAGLVPRLTTPGVVPSVDIWRVALMRPRASPEGPLVSLAECLFRGESEIGADEHGRSIALPEIAESDHATAEELADLLMHADETAARPLVRALDRVSEHERQKSGYQRPVRAELLLVVDQLDELFASDTPEQQRRQFSRLLAVLLATDRVWVIATLRADLYERVLEDRDLFDLKTRGAAYDLAPPGTPELAEIVRRPAEAAALVYETNARSGERLDDRLLADADRPDMLPLLQFTLQQLFDQRETVGDETRLTFAAYQRLGGLAGAIDKEAERAIAPLDEAARERLPRLLRQLAAPAQGLDGSRDAARLTVRSIPMREAAYDEASTRLVRALIDARVLLSSGSGEHATVRLAHQRVLESWGRARQIASASTEFYRVRQEVEDEEQRWEASGRKGDRLIPAGLPLAEAENIRTRYAGELSREVCAYIDASSQRGRARQRRQRIAVAAFALLAVIASAAGVWALKQQRQAEDALRESRASTSRFLADLARQRLAEDRLGEAVALARRAVPLEIKDWPTVGTAQNALALAMQAYSSAMVRPMVGYVGHEGTVRGAAFSPDGTRLLTWSYDATARLWDVETGGQLRVLQHDDGVRGARFSADGRRALTWSFDRSVRLWNLASGGNAIVLRHDDIVVDAGFSKDETQVLSWSYDGTARLWDAASGRQLALLRHEAVVHDARFFDGDRRILTRSFDGSVGIWRAADGAALATLKHEAVLRGAVLFAHETRVLTWSDDKSARVWDALTGTQLLRFDHELSVEGAALSTDESRILTWSNKLVLMSDAVTGKSRARFEHEDAVRGATLSKQGTRLLTWSGRTVQLWEVASGKLIGRLSHSDLVLGARFSPDESQILSWSYDGTAQLWSDPGGKGSRHSQLRHEAVVRAAIFSRDGAWVWTRSDDGTARLWASRTGLVGHEAAILRHQAEVLDMVWDRNRNRVVTVSADGTARLWDTAPTDRVVELHHDEKVLGSAYSRDGARLLTWSADHTARLWDVETAKQRLVLRHDDVVQGAAFSPDRGPILTWSADRSIRLWDADKGDELMRFNGPAPVRGAMRTHDRLLAWFEDGSIGLWNAETGARLAQYPHCGDRVGATFSADGRYALTWCSDGTLRTLDSERATPIGTMAHNSVSGASFSPDGSHMLSWADDGTLRVWDIHRSKPIAEMRCSRAVEGAIFFPRSDRLLSWSGENAAKIWDAVTGKQLLELTHAGQVNGALLDGDGTRLWTWSIDGSARLWQATTGNELLRLQHADAVAEAALVANGRTLFTRTVTSGGTTVRLWDSRTGDLLASFPDAPHAAVAEDSRHLVTWYDGPSAFIWPLWAPTQVLAERASHVTERLRPLSQLDRCHAYLDTAGCDQLPATTERELALAGDEKHLRQSVVSLSPSTIAPVAKEVRSLAHVKFELVVNDRSEAIVFHNQPFRTPLERVEFNTSTRRLAFVLQNGVTTEFGLNVSPSFTKYLESSNRVLMVLMNNKTGEPIGGDYYPLLVY